MTEGLSYTLARIEGKIWFCVDYKVGTMPIMWFANKEAAIDFATGFIQNILKFPDGETNTAVTEIPEVFRKALNEL